ncbi:MAG: GAF and ANTAR domain-containing protein [Acidobacteria bacterium]|nr:GAF and ANTAR domain-containing protein [Acidobacteriota bacterium]
MVERESLLVATLVEMADNLVDDYDVIDILTLLSERCVETIDVAAAGVMLEDTSGELQYLASSSDSMRLLELYQIQTNEGPCVDCYTAGAAIVNHELSQDDHRWPSFTPRAMEQGFRSVHCLPMRLRGRTIGALNLFRTDVGLLTDEDVAAVQGLADIATIAILQHQVAIGARLLNDQLSLALNSRITIEQAKGMIGQYLQCDMADAFTILRAHSRNHNLRLTDVAASVVEGNLPMSELDRPHERLAKGS